MEYTERMKRGHDYFTSGYNCSQAVILAFSDLTGLDDKTALRLASSFGGGMGRMREVCGAVSAMFMVAGLLYGYSEPTDGQEKQLHYALIRTLADEFKAKNGTVLCRDLLADVQTTPGGEPEKRTAEYYQRRPCPEYVADCIAILEKVIKEKSKHDSAI